MQLTYPLPTVCFYVFTPPPRFRPFIPRQFEPINRAFEFYSDTPEDLEHQAYYERRRAETRRSAIEALAAVVNDGDEGLEFVQGIQVLLRISDEELLRVRNELATAAHDRTPESPPSA